MDLDKPLRLALIAGAVVFALAQSQPVAFEVASVKPSNPRAADGGAKGEGGGLPFRVEPERFSSTNRRLYGLIIQAYGVRGCRPLGEVDCSLVVGGPDWIKKDRFDVQAKMPSGSPIYTTTQFLNGEATELQFMLQTLLVDRFHLKVHRESRQLPVYELTIAKQGHKLKKADETETPSLVFRPSVQSDGVRTLQLDAKNQSLREVAEMYTRVLGRPVLDRTGLQGKFDFTVEYDADTDAPGAFTELAGPAVFRAFQEQVGLRFISTKGSVEVLVIDHAEHPTEN